MGRIKVRLEVPELDKAYEITIDPDADGVAMARGLAAELKLPGEQYFLKPKGPIGIRDGGTLELLPESPTASWNIIKPLD